MRVLVRMLDEKSLLWFLVILHGVFFTTILLKAGTVSLNVHFAEDGVHFMFNRAEGGTGTAQEGLTCFLQICQINQK